MPFPNKVHENTCVKIRTDNRTGLNVLTLGPLCSPFVCLNSCNIPNTWLIPPRMLETNTGSISFHAHARWREIELLEPVTNHMISSVESLHDSLSDWNDRSLFPNRTVRMDNRKIANEIQEAEAAQLRGDFAIAVAQYKVAVDSGAMSNHTIAKIMYNMSLCNLGLGDVEKASKIRERILVPPMSSRTGLVPPIPLHIHSAPVELIRLAKKSLQAGDVSRAIRYLDMVSVSRAFRFDVSLLTLLSTIDESRSQSLESAAKSILPSLM